MTERMENALNHIKTSVDVDPWAMEEVERVFKMLDDVKTEINQSIEDSWCEEKTEGLEEALDIIDKHMKGGD